METPRIVTRSRRSETVDAANFRFTSEMIPASDGKDFLQAYRKNAWQQFERLPIPNTQNEAWRRTDLKPLEAGTFVLPQGNQLADLAPIPPNLLEPVADEAHGGEILISPEGAQVRLSKELIDQGVVFADFQTAAEKYPDQLSRILGNLVKPEEGKFAALTGALATQAFSCTSQRESS